MPSTRSRPAVIIAATLAALVMKERALERWTMERVDIRPGAKPAADGEPPTPPAGSRTPLASSVQASWRAGRGGSGEKKRRKTTTEARAARQLEDDREGDPGRVDAPNRNQHGTKRRNREEEDEDEQPEGNTPDPEAAPGFSAFQRRGALRRRGLAQDSTRRRKLRRPSVRKTAQKPTRHRVDDIEGHVGGLGQAGAHPLGDVDQGIDQDQNLQPVNALHLDRGEFRPLVIGAAQKGSGKTTKPNIRPILRGSK